MLAILEKEYNAKLILADEVGRELMQRERLIMSISLMHLEKKFKLEDQTIDTKKTGSNSIFKSA